MSMKASIWRKRGDGECEEKKREREEKEVIRKMRIGQRVILIQS
jgi:hypothetical protein